MASCTDVRQGEDYKTYFDGKAYVCIDIIWNGRRYRIQYNYTI